eukprot:s278_g43.t1
MPDHAGLDEVTEPAEPGLAEKQAALRKALKQKAKQARRIDEVEKATLKEQKAKAKQDAADLRESKRLARIAAAEEKEKKKENRIAAAEEKEKKKENQNGNGKHVSDPSMGSQTTSASASGANDAPAAAEPKRKRLRRMKNAEPDVESGKPAAEDKPDCPKPTKVIENFELLQSAKISELETDLGNRKSFTVRPYGDGVMNGARAIGVVLTSASFYVNKLMLTTDEWPPTLHELYKVGGLWKFDAELIASNFNVQSFACGYWHTLHMVSLLFWPRLRLIQRKV